MKTVNAITITLLFVIDGRKCELDLTIQICCLNASKTGVKQMKSAVLPASCQQLKHMLGLLSNLIEVS